jgi:hypothetical protein
MPATATRLNQLDAHRFTLDGSSELESRLMRLCERIRQAALEITPARKLQALVLGGGYGRGQGGVLKSEAGDLPYNDLEFYVFLRGNYLLNEARYRPEFQKLGEILTPEAGLHVEFKVDSSAKLRRSPVSIFSYDLVSGHRIIYGDDTAFAGCEHHLDAAKIAPAEATRLLLNRCSGLLLVKELLLKKALTTEESDFVGRNLAKAKLALGDALLAARGKYHWDCLERAQRLRQLIPAESSAAFQLVLEHHAAGVRFKLHPNRAVSSIEAFAAEHRTLSELALREWLWIENQRLKANFSSVREYAFSSRNKSTGGGLFRNLLLNVRTFGATATLDGIARRYPRERLFNALPLLLEKTEGAAELNTKRHLQRQLHTRAEDWNGLVAAYKHVWSYYG